MIFFFFVIGTKRNTNTTAKKPSDCKGFSQSVWLDWHGSESVGVALKVFPWAGLDHCGGEPGRAPRRCPDVPGNHSAVRELEGLAGQPTVHPLVQSAQKRREQPLFWAETWVGTGGLHVDGAHTELLNSALRSCPSLEQALALTCDAAVIKKKKAGGFRALLERGTVHPARRARWPPASTEVLEGPYSGLLGTSASLSTFSPPWGMGL